MMPVKPQHTIDVLRVLSAATQCVTCKDALDDGHRTTRRWHDG